MADQLQAGQAELRRYGETNVAMLDAVFRQSPVGLAFVDPQLRYLRVNQHAGREPRPGLGRGARRARRRRGPAGAGRPRPAALPAGARDAGARDGAGGRVAARGRPGPADLVAGQLLSRGGGRGARRDRRGRRGRDGGATARGRPAPGAGGRAPGRRGHLAPGGAEHRALPRPHVARGRPRLRGAPRAQRAGRGRRVPAGRRGARALRGRARPGRRGRRAARRRAPGAGRPRSAGRGLRAAPARRAAHRRRRVGGRGADRLRRRGPGVLELRFAAADAPSADALEAARAHGRPLHAGDRGGRGCSTASTTWPRRCSAASCPAGCPWSTASRSTRRFRPAGIGTLVGGDFYDVIVLDDASLVLVVGDVCGKGARAAAATALVRYAIRAEAQRPRQPAALLENLDAALTGRAARQRPLRHGRVRDVRARRGRARRRLSLAGSPPPLVTRAEGGCAVVGRPGPVVGIGLRGLSRGPLHARRRRCPPPLHRRADRRPGPPSHRRSRRSLPRAGRARERAGPARGAAGRVARPRGREPEVLPRDDIAMLGIRVT